MLNYEWGNPSTIMLSGEEHEHEHEPTLHSDPSNHVIQPAFIEPFSHSNHFNPFYDPSSSYSSPCHYAPPPLPGPGRNDDTEFVVVPKSEEVPVDFSSRIGLNLGGRTYFSSSEDDFVNRLYRRSRIGEICSTNSPKCQAEGCNADLTNAKHYHRRHKVCDFHSKASTVITAGLTQRFCQQCSRFHLLAEFDNGKRSCRKRLADHNRRRRKTQQSSQLPETTLIGSVMDSRDQSSWSVTVAVSPPQVSLDSFHQRSYQAMASSSSSNSLFYSSG